MDVFTSVHQQFIDVSALRCFIGAGCSQAGRAALGSWPAASVRGQAGGRSTPTSVSLTDAFRYLLIFLKFVQAVIPTIEYDYTRHFTM